MVTMTETGTDTEYYEIFHNKTAAFDYLFCKLV